MGEHLDQVCGQERGLARLGGVEGTLDPLERLGHECVLSGAWIWVTGGRVRLGDRGQPACQGGGPVGLGECDQVEGHGLGRGRKGRDCPAIAPGGEVLPVER